MPDINPAGDDTSPDRFPPVMTVEQVADYLQISKRKAYDLAAAGDIPAAKVGDQWRFYRPEIDRWLVHLSRSNVGDSAPADLSVGSPNGTM